MHGEVDVDLVRKGLHDTTVGDWKLDLYGRAKALRVQAVVSGSKDRVRVGPAGRKVNDGRWHRATLARTGETVSLTVDGRIVAATRRNVGMVRHRKAEALTIGGKRRPIREGDYRPDADWFRGVIDEVVITVG